MTFELEDYYFERHIVYNVTVLFAEVNFYQILHLHRCIYYRQFVLVSQSNIYFQALYVKPTDNYDLHWPMRRGRLNIHPGPGGTVTAVLADIETIWATAIQKHLDIPLKDLKVRNTVITPSKCQSVRHTTQRFQGEKHRKHSK